MTTELYEEGGAYYYFEKGRLAEGKGLIKYQGAYYFIGEDGKAAVSKTVNVPADKVNDTGFPADSYQFGADGKMIIHEGIVKISGVLYYFEGGIKKAAGLIKVGEDYYYAAEGGKIVVSASYDVTVTNDLKPAGIYRFDANGKMIIYTGIVKEDGALYYYKSGKREPNAGLIYFEGDYYYIGEMAKAAVNATVNVTEDKVNDTGIEPGVYTFGPDGKMIIEEKPALNGIVEGYYYENDIRIHKGLIHYFDGFYYYAAEGGKIVTGQSWKVEIVNDTGYEPGYYLFDNEGHLRVDFTGFNTEDGVIYYYKNGKRVYGAGLIYSAGNYYYVSSDGPVLASITRWIDNVNGIVPAGIYRFAEDGKIILTTELVDENGSLIYYERGRFKPNAGLIKYEDSYYYIASGAKAVAGKSYWVEKTNDTPFAKGTYKFGPDGKMEMYQGIVKVYYYVDGALAAFDSVEYGAAIPTKVTSIVL